jgi:hypothetical protein
LTKKIMVRVRCVLDHPGLEVLSQQRGPRLAQHRSDDVSAVDDETDEEALVKEPTDPRAAESVYVVDALEQVECLGESLLDAGINHLGSFEDPLCLCQLGVDALVLLTGQIAGDATGDDQVAMLAKIS